MRKEFDDVEIERNRVFISPPKSLISMISVGIYKIFVPDDVNIDKIFLLKKICCGKKRFQVFSWLQN